MNQGPIWGRLLKKTRGRKSRATVPLNDVFETTRVLVLQSLLNRIQFIKFTYQLYLRICTDQYNIILNFRTRKSLIP